MKPLVMLLAGLVLASSVQAAELSFTFEDADVKHVFQAIGREGGYNVLLDPAVEGTVSVELEAVGSVEAVELVARLLGYSYLVRERTIIVVPTERQALFESREIAYYTLRYLTDPAEVEAILALVLAPEDMYIQEKTGLVILQGTPAELEQAAALLDQADRSEPELDPDQPGQQNLLRVFQRIAHDLGLTLVGHPDLLEQELFIEWRDYEPWEMAEHLAEILPISVRRTERTLVVDVVADEPEQERISIFRLDYLEPEMAASVLQMAAADSQIQVDRGGKSVIVRAKPDDLLAMEELLAEYDTPPLQVLLEVWVQEMSMDALQTLGLEWKGLPSFDTYGAPKFLELVWEPWELVLALRMLQEQGQADVLARPSIAAVSGEEASIFVGDRVPVRIDTEDGTTIQTFESGIDLRVLPRVSSDGYITISIRPEVSSFTWDAASDFPQTRTREAETTVRVKDGQPILIGGLVQEREEESVRRLPVISDLPIVGRLFRSTRTSTARSEMTIFIIPHIVDGSEGLVTRGYMAPAEE